MPEPCDAARRIEAALARREVAAAATGLAAARDTDAMSLAQEMSLADQILHALTYDRELPGLAVLKAATVLGWYGGSGPPDRSLLLDRLHARIDAEQWLIQTHTRARSWRFYYGSHRAAAARLLLGRGPARFAALLPPEPPLRRTLAEFHLHQSWIGDRLDADRIDAVERIARRRYTTHAGRFWLCMMLLPLVAVSAAKFGGVAALLFWWGSEWLRGYARPIIIAFILATLATVLMGA